MKLATAVASVGRTKTKSPDLKYTIKASDGYVFTSPVGSFKPNPFGRYDMYGNPWRSNEPTLTIP